MTDGLTRRAAIRAVGAGVLAASLPWFPAPRASAAGRRVDVVGAGLSGLACALALREAGIDVRVWEARPRLGGRTLTDTALIPGRWVECGGEFIDSGHAAIRRLCSGNGIALQDLEAVDVPGVPRDLIGGRLRSGGWADAAQARLAARARSDLQRLGEDRLNAMSAADWLKGAIPGGTGSPFARYERALVTGEYGADPAALSALWLVADLADDARGAEMGEGPERYRINGGTGRLIAALEQRIGPGRIIRGTRLTALVRGGATPALFLTGPDGPRVERPVRAAITLPPGVLRSVNLRRAGIPAAEREVIRTFGMGTNAKVIIPFTDAAWQRRGWNGDGLSDTALGQTWNATMGEGSGAAAFTSLVGGRAGRDIPGPDHGPAPDAIVRTRLALMDRIAPGTRAAARAGAVVHAWAKDPYARGSYSAARPGQADFPAIAARPQGPFHFAGEHTSDNWSGYMEGAVQSGQRAAREVIARLRG